MRTACPPHHRGPLLLAALLACAGCVRRPPPGEVAEGALPSSRTAPARGGPAGLISLAVGGDVTLGFRYEEYVEEQLARGRTRQEMYAYGFSGVKAAAADADLFLVNLECPFTDRGEKLPKNFNFRASPHLVLALVEGGVDAVSLANNHLMDYGPVGLMDTIATLETAKIAYFGAGRTLAEARRPAVVEVGGVKVALLGYFFLGDRNIEPPEVIATETTPGVAGHHSDVGVMERMVVEDVRAARRHADLVLPFFHWGREGKSEIEPYQRQLALAAIEAGAAGVLGSHPHVLQGMELHQGAPVGYSLGNFVFGGNWNPRNKDSVLWKLRFSPAGYQSSELVPLKTDEYPLRPIQPYVLEGAPGLEVLRKLAEYSRPFPQPLPELAGFLSCDAGTCG